MNEERKLTPAELAADLRISERTVARMVDEGCPYHLVGARKRFLISEVNHWTRQKAQECQSSNSKTARGTSLSASTVNAFTDACRRVQLRVRPGGSKPNSSQQQERSSPLSLVTQD